MVFFFLNRIRIDDFDVSQLNIEILNTEPLIKFPITVSYDFKITWTIIDNDRQGHGN